MLENMLDYVRIALYTLLIFLAFLLFQAWEVEHSKVTLPSQPMTSEGHYVPDLTLQDSRTAVSSGQASVPVENGPTVGIPPDTKGQLVTVKTDVLAVTIDTHGGDIVDTKLLQYPDSLGSKTPFTLFTDDPKTRYLAESGLLSTRGPDTPKEQAVYTTPQTEYQLSPDANKLLVNLKWQKDDINVTKTYTFTRGRYEVGLNYEVENKSSTPWEGSLYAQLLRTNAPPENHGGMVNLATYFGAAISSPAKPFEKISFKDMQDKNLSQTIQDGWAAMIQHYFISAWVPAPGTTATYYSKVTPNGLYTIGLINQPIHAEPGATVQTGAKLYAGPTIGAELEKTAPHLNLTIDYGWFWFLSDIIFWMMQKIYNVVGNWGWSIVIVTIIIKLMFYHLSAKSYRSMSQLKKLQPRIEMLKERYKDDKQGLTQATMELYREEKVNPMTGCLPVLIQIPVFIALYWVLVESVQLRQAPFILWIHDLSQHDPYYVLPILMGISMYLGQRLNPPPPDPMQAKVMMLMPVIFTALFINFPAGLMLYWFVNNTLSFLQQWYIMRSMNHSTNGK